MRKLSILRLIGPYFLLILGTALLVPQRMRAQKDFLFDSLKKNLSLAVTDKDKIYALLELADDYKGLDNDLSRQYAAQAMQVAELGRNRKLIAMVYLRNGNRYLQMSGLSDNLQLARENYLNAEKVARDNELDEELGYSYIGLARTFRGKGESDKALNYNNQALSIASGSNSDSLKVLAYSSMGRTYQFRNEKLLAFRNYLEALDVAELSKKDVHLKFVYSSLVEFYTNLEEYDKAIDYQMKITAIDEKNHDRYSLLDDYNSTGVLFSKKKQIDLALTMFERSIVLCDSLQFPTYKLDPNLSIANVYFENDQVAKGMEYLSNHPEIMDYFNKAGMGFFFDEGYGTIYTDLGKYDSALYYLKKAEPQIEQKASAFRKQNFYRKFGEYYKARKDYKNAITYYLKARDIGSTIKDMDDLQNSAKNLDTLYGLIGDYKTAYSYNIEYNLYKDSIKTLSRETDLLKMEVENDNKRRDRLAKEEEEDTLRRHNIQYMGLTAGLAGLFILLVMLGFFVVHPRTIRAVGFFSFIFLFEFIILIADKQIHEWTHGEPWKILIIKIFLAAVLLPLHHWLEHKVIHYLTSRKKIVAPGIPLWGKVFKKKQNVPSEPV
jgi:tetratricopeptide (TPR) repeat protein